MENFNFIEFTLSDTNKKVLISRQCILAAEEKENGKVTLYLTLKNWDNIEVTDRYLDIKQELSLL